MGLLARVWEGAFARERRPLGQISGRRISPQRLYLVAADCAANINPRPDCRPLGANGTRAREPYALGEQMYSPYCVSYSQVSAAVLVARVWVGKQRNLPSGRAAIPQDTSTAVLPRRTTPTHTPSCEM